MSSQKVRFTAANPADSLILDVRNLQFPEPSRMTFDVFLACDAHVEYTRQVWDNGHKLYDGSLFDETYNLLNAWLSANGAFPRGPIAEALAGLCSAAYCSNKGRSTAAIS